MLYLVVKREDGRDVCVNSDGTTTPDRDRAELMTEDVATLTANLYGGGLRSDYQMFPQDFEEEDRQ